MTFWMSHVPLLTGSSPAASPATQSADNTPSNSDNSGHYAFTRWQPHEEQEILVDSELDHDMLATVQADD